MPSLGLEAMPTAPPDKKKRWNKMLTVALGAIIVFFFWVIINNLSVLYFGKSLTGR
jgi:hypothetical protein